MDPADALTTLTILEPGDYVSMQGKQVSFGAADLAAIAASYDFASNPAPLVIGHPRTNDPAWGWVRGVRVEDGRLVADVTDIDDAFAELVRDGRYRRISPSFYPKGARANPAPAAPYLRHIGFLGAMAPAMRNLPPVNFSEADEAELITIDFVTEEEHPMPDPTPNDAANDFAEQQATLDARAADLDAREAALKAERQLLDDAAAEARHADNVSFAESLASEGKLPPAQVDRVAFLLDAADSAPEELSFGEGDEAETPAAALRALLSGAGELLNFGEAAGKAKGEPDADTDPNAIADKAKAYQAEQKAKGRNISVAEAVRHVTAKTA